jgi:hypothetical protein
VLAVDSVIGSRPTGWWRDRPGAARAFVADLVAAVATGTVMPPVVVVLEGAARAGVPAGPVAPGVDVVHAPGAGDDTIVAMVEEAVGASAAVEVVTADRGLRDRVLARGATVTGPGRLLERLDLHRGGDPCP